MSRLISSTRPWRRVEERVVVGLQSLFAVRADDTQDLARARAFEGFVLVDERLGQLLAGRRPTNTCTSLAIRRHSYRTV